LDNSLRYFRTFGIIAAALAVMGLTFQLTIIKPMQAKLKENTAATVTIVEDKNKLILAAQEYKQGDTIALDNVILDIVKIDTKGSIKVVVAAGNLYNENGEIVKDCILRLNEKHYFTTDVSSTTGTRYEVCVTAHRS